MEFGKPSSLFINQKRGHVIMSDSNVSKQTFDASLKIGTFTYAKNIAKLTEYCLKYHFT